MKKSVTLAAMLATGMALQACSADATETADPASTDTAETSEEAQVEAPPAEPDWTGINDSAVRAEIDQQLAAFDEQFDANFGLLVVERLEGENRFQAAGEAAWEQYGPTIVVATAQRDVQIVGDEALAYFVDDRIRIQNGMAERFDRGEFSEAMAYALGEMEEFWGSE